MTRHIGDIRIDRVIESEGPDFVAHELIPDATPEALAPHRHWLEPHYVDFASMKLVMAMQTYVLRHGRNVILVDTCVGNHKARRFHAPWNQRTDTVWLDNLAKAGVRVEDVTHVMCTHLHIDHVGWNTRLANGRWAPTFPNARYVFAAGELAFWQDRHRTSPELCPWITDSVLPIIAANRADVVSNDHAVDDEICLVPTPGHTIDHVSVLVGRPGADALITGDMMHSPLQGRYPELGMALEAAYFYYGALFARLAAGGFEHRYPPDIREYSERYVAQATEAAQKATAATADMTEKVL